MRFLFWLKKLIEENPLLFLILTIGFLLRFISVYPGYFYPHGDELLYSQALYMIINKTLSFQPQYFGFPPLIPWLMIPFFLTIFIPGAWLITLLRHMPEVYMLFVPMIVFLLGISFVLRRKINFFKTFAVLFWISLIITGVIVISKGTLFHNEILGKNWLSVLYWGRYLTVGFGTGAIYLVYEIVIEFFDNKRAALLSSFFTAINYRLVLNSHVGLPDMYNVFFLMIALLMVGKLIKKGSVKNYLLTWLSLTAAFLIKYQFHIFIPFAITHLIISIKQSKGKLKNFFKASFSPRVVLGGVMALVIVLIVHVYHFLNWDKFLEINSYQAIKYGFGRNTFDLFVVSYLYHVGIGVALSLSAIFGIVLGFWKKTYRLQSLILLSVLPTFMYLYLYYTGGGFYTRNLISAIPIFLIFSAIFVDFIISILGKIIKSKFLRLTFALVIVSLVVFDQFKNSVVTAYEYSRVSPRQRAYEWLSENVKGELVFGRYSGNPVPTDERVILKSLFPFSHAFSYKELSQEGFDKAIIEMTWIRAELLWWTRKPPSVQIKFWNKPNDLLSQSYYALAFRELLWSHGLKLFITPWQATSHHFAVVDLAKSEPLKKRDLVAKYLDFSDDWTPLSFLERDMSFLKLNEKGKLVIEKGDSIPGGIRWQSKSFPIEEGRGYIVNGKVRNLEPLPKEARQAFLRLDFYAEEPKVDILSRPTVSFVSERVYGREGLHDLTIEGVAPSGAKFLKVGFQGMGVESTYTLESLEIWESTKGTVVNMPHLIISDDDLFLPNDEGIL